MKLTDTQRSLLEAAAKHPQKLLTDFPANLKGGALIKVLTALGNAGLIAPHNKTPEGNTQFVISTAGLESIGLTPQQPPKQREGTKQATLIELLKRPEGVSLAEMVQATGWQQHYADVLVMPTCVGNPACVAERVAMKSA
ncbi:hypothetical protein B9Z38_16135 [Limnohabitans sp. MMS-10A-160]|uniref:DUF3489 domain-containing protein n=1 Tax=Limnohabitans sp. MMS-10A-160 TaxID=1835766 RepID=UPI000D36EC43|nr:DUF3489 domain-containing protein [Limnohabitans sp. MMS-10A-160]PUE22639.1 hypothetical protein B9Z38_16135 [Limnohabitans sp. MMS-10A-160]